MWFLGLICSEFLWALVDGWCAGEQPDAAHSTAYSLNKVVMTTSSPHPLPSIGLLVNSWQRQENCQHQYTLEFVPSLSEDVAVFKVHCKSKVDVTTDVLSNWVHFITVKERCVHDKWLELCLYMCIQHECGSHISPYPYTKYLHLGPIFSVNDCIQVNLYTFFYLH